MDEEDFQNGDISIRYLDDHPDLMNDQEEDDLMEAAAVAVALLEEGRRGRLNVSRQRGVAEPEFSAWRKAGMPCRGRR